MAKAILRIEKVHSWEVSGRGAHNHRTKPVDNADPAKTHLNKLLIGTTHLRSDIQTRIKEGYKGESKIRKDAVLACEMVLTASPDFFENLPEERFQEWIETNINFAKNRYGSENVVNAVLHCDELTPHLHIMIVPLTADGKKLNQKAVFGGPRDLSGLQTDYANEVAKYGLERGKVRDFNDKENPTKHKDLATYKAEVKKALEISDPAIKAPRPQIPKEFKALTGLYTTDEVLDLMRYQQRLFYNKNKPAFASAPAAAELQNTIIKNKKLEEEAEKLRKQKEALLQKAKDLNGQLDTSNTALEKSRENNRVLREKYELVPNDLKIEIQNKLNPPIVETPKPSLERKHPNGLSM